MALLCLDHGKLFGQDRQNVLAMLVEHITELGIVLMSREVREHVLLKPHCWSPKTHWSQMIEELGEWRPW